MNLHPILLIAVLSMPFIAAGQTCEAYMAFEEGTKLEYTYYNKKDKEEGSSTQYVKSITALPDGSSVAVFDMELRDKKGKESMSGTFEVNCQGNALRLNVSDMLGPNMSEAFQNMEVEVAGEALVIPHELEVGQTLPDATSVVTPTMSGMNLMQFTFTVSDRQVAAREEVSTPAGTFDCFKIASRFKTKVMGSREFTQAQWLAKGVGMVKAETYNAKGKLESRQLLTGLER